MIECSTLASCFWPATDWLAESKRPVAMAVAVDNSRW